MNNNNFIPNNEHFLKRARNIRNELLNKTDKYILSDYPISLSRSAPAPYRPCRPDRTDGVACSLLCQQSSRLGLSEEA